MEFAVADLFLLLFWFFAAIALMALIWWVIPEDQWSMALQKVVPESIKLPVSEVLSREEQASENSPSQSFAQEISKPEAEEDAIPTDSLQPDDLTLLKGVDQKMATMMNNQGIYRYEQLRAMDKPRRRALASTLGVHALSWTAWEDEWARR